MKTSQFFNSFFSILDRESKPKRKNSKAFTLIELLVVVAIIGILAALIFVSMNGAQASARDGRRQSELSQTKKSLQAYYLQNGRYPTTTADGISLESDSDTNGTFSQAMKTGGYMSIIPRDPKYASDGDFAYKYISTSTNAFILCAKTEVSDGYACIDQTSGGGIAFSDEPPVTFGGWGGGGGGFTCGVSTVTFTYNGSSVTYGTVSNPTTSECWLDRNLGAAQVATAFNDSLAYGDLFQWGRLADGHQVRTSLATTTTSSSDVPGHAKFIYGMNGNWDWRSPQNDNLWLGSPGINNPCPSGWRVPTGIELIAEYSSWSPQNYTGAFNSPLKLTAAGLRQRTDGLVYATGTSGWYWGTFSGLFPVSNLDIESGSVGLDGDNRRAFGFSVRCIKD